MHEFLKKFVRVYKEHFIVYTLIFIILTAVSAGIILIPVLIFAFAIGVYYLIYYFKTLNYYRSNTFQSLKSRLATKIAEYNEFDNFMDETRLYISQKQSQLSHSNTRNSTLTVYKNSVLDIYKYIVKYFFNETKINEETMQIIEQILQKYNTINNTHDVLQIEYDALMNFIQKNMYRGAYIFNGLTMKKLGSRKLPKFKQDYFIWYSFNYSSPTNRKSYRNSITLNEEKLQDFAEYLNALIKYRASAKFQRQLMTPQLREHILVRDQYTCKYCGVSRRLQSHLLLEVDHINPIANGGITIESNLQSLCWKCNRTKGSKTGYASTTSTAIV